MSKFQRHSKKIIIFRFLLLSIVIINFSELVLCSLILFIFCYNVSLFWKTLHRFSYTCRDFHTHRHSKTAIESEREQFFWRGILNGRPAVNSCAYTQHKQQVYIYYSIMYNSWYLHRHGRAETVTWDYNTNIIIG